MFTRATVIRADGIKVRGRVGIGRDMAMAMVGITAEVAAIMVAEIMAAVIMAVGTVAATAMEMATRTEPRAWR